MNDIEFPDNSKFLIIHADDAGLSHSENIATIRALEYGIVKSYSIMTPSPWFLEIAHFARENANFDVGIHLTLTCEWSNYKFRPILSQTVVPSLVDNYGFFHSTIEEFKNKASVKDVEKELRAQINRAIKFGVTPTHLDSHMFALGTRTDLFEIYIKLGDEYGLPVLLNSSYKQLMGIDSSRFQDMKSI